MSLAEFAACIEGWNAVHGGEPAPDPMSDEEHNAMLAEFGFAPE